MKGKIKIRLKDYEYLTGIEKHYKLRKDELEDIVRQLSGRVVELEYIIKDITEATQRTDICVVAKINLICDILKCN